MTMINAFDPATAQGIAEADQELIRRRSSALGPAYRLFYQQPLHLVRGEGVYLFDAHGRRYLDAYNNVASVGHCHPLVVQAIARQAAVLNTHSRYLHEGIVSHAERLLKLLPSELQHVMYTCTGSEANDLAIRVARESTKGTGIVVTSLAYHGVTATISEISPSLGEGCPLGAHVRAVPPPNFAKDGAEAGQKFSEAVDRAFDELQRSGIKPCALIVDTIFASDGVLPEPRGTLREAAAVAHRRGALFIADEVQPGFARVGTAFWGFVRHGVIPDIVTMGKPMGNGHPVAAAVFQAAILERFGHKVRYFNTFGGNPVSMAAANAVLDVIESEGLAVNAETVGAELRHAIVKLRSRYACVHDVRGAGLFTGVDIVDPQTGTADGVLCGRIVNDLKERGVLISACGPAANTLKIRPPLPFGRGHILEFMDALDSTLRGLG